MAELVYSAIRSLDGYVADERGNFDWSAPDDEVHAAVNGVVHTCTTHCAGNRVAHVARRPQ